MNAAPALQGLLPLIVFAVVDMFASMRVAIIESIWSWYSFGEVDKTKWISLWLILAMGAISIRMKSDKLFKFQPVAMGAVFALTLAYFQWRGQPLTVQMIPKMASLLPAEQQAVLQEPQVIALLTRLDLSMVVVFVLHGSLVAWAALKKSTMYWLVVRGVGFYVILFVDVLVVRVFGSF